MATTLGLGIDATSWCRKGLITQETKEERERAFWFTFIQGALLRLAGCFASCAASSLLTLLLTSQTSCGPLTSVDLLPSLPSTMTRPFRQSSKPLTTDSGTLGSKTRWSTRTTTTRRAPSYRATPLPPSFGPPSSPSSRRRLAAPSTPSNRTLELLTRKPSLRIFIWSSESSTRPSLQPSPFHRTLRDFNRRTSSCCTSSIGESSFPPSPSPPRRFASPRFQPSNADHHPTYRFQVLLLHRPFFPRKRGETSTPASELAVKSCEKAA